MVILLGVSGFLPVTLKWVRFPISHKVQLASAYAELFMSRSLGFHAIPSSTEETESLKVPGPGLAFPLPDHPVSEPLLNTCYIPGQCCC